MPMLDGIAKQIVADCLRNEIETWTKRHRFSERTGNSMMASKAEHYLGAYEFLVEMLLGGDIPVSSGARAALQEDLPPRRVDDGRIGEFDPTRKESSRPQAA